MCVPLPPKFSVALYFDTDSSIFQSPMQGNKMCTNDVDCISKFVKPMHAPVRCASVTRTYSQKVLETTDTK